MLIFTYGFCAGALVLSLAWLAWCLILYPPTRATKRAAKAATPVPVRTPRPGAPENYKPHDGFIGDARIEPPLSDRFMTARKG